MYQSPSNLLWKTIKLDQRERWLDLRGWFHLTRDAPYIPRHQFMVPMTSAESTQLGRWIQDVCAHWEAIQGGWEPKFEAVHFVNLFDQSHFQEHYDFLGFLLAWACFLSRSPSKFDLQPLVSSPHRFGVQKSIRIYTRQTSHLVLMWSAGSVLIKRLADW